MAYWLLKSEPDTFSYHHLVNSSGQRTVWDGVRNYQARNLLRDAMQLGDMAFFYHSSCKEPAIVGICQVVRTHAIDTSAFDPNSPYFDAKSNPDSPRWISVEVQAVKALATPVTLKAMRNEEALAEMVLLTQPRLSVQPVTEQQWRHVLAMAGDDEQH